MFKPYRRRQIAELRPYVPGENMMGIGVSDADKLAGSPKRGDMIARNPKNYKDQWQSLRNTSSTILIRHDHARARVPGRAGKVFLFY
jgi:hypothetical protein